MMTALQSKCDCVYQIKTTLEGSVPPIWRRFQVLGGISLHRLHEILQVVMGWTNSHLYRFDIEGAYFGEPDPEYADYDINMKNAKRTKLNQIGLTEKMKFTYQYDFGDNWLHEVLVERIFPVEPEKNYPICLGGKHACPPEDCGGIWGYTHLLEVIRDPAHEEHGEMIEWLGGEFDPDKFDMDNANLTLRSSSSRRHNKE